MKRLAPFILFALAACGGVSPEPDTYALSAVPGAALPQPAETVRIQRPSLPGYLDRPQIVHSDGDRVMADEMNRWAEPLDTMFERVFAEDLRQRLPAAMITTEDDDQPSLSCRRLETEIQQFNRADGGYALKAQFIIRDACGCSPRAMPGLFAGTEDGGSNPEALSRLVAAYADKIAVSLQQAGRPPERTAACSSPLPAAPGR